MREIRFRGKCIDTNTINSNKIVFGNLVIVLEKYFIVECLGEDSFIWNEVNPETVGQFTDLKDKSGKEIYEGDKYKHPRSGFHGEVIYDGGSFYIRWADGQKEYIYIASSYADYIGNIYENSDRRLEGK